uniref:Uncharacterized protein n=1 Tax=Magallana gigas TaxID=29159 RepID=A0A8W8M5K9_MAGGI
MIAVINKLDILLSKPKTLGVQEMGNGASADESPNAIRVQATPTPRDNRTQNGGPPDRARRKGGGFQEVEMQHASQNNTPRQSNTPRQNANRPGQSSEGRSQRQSQPGGSTQRQGQAPGGSTPRQHGQGNQRGSSQPSGQEEAVSSVLCYQCVLYPNPDR